MTFSAYSDERLKEHVEAADIDMCYDIIKDLPLSRWKWKEGFGGIDRNKLGWIAQDVEKIFPKSVNSVNGNLTINGDQIYATMWGAIRKLQVLTEALKDAMSAVTSAP